MSNLALRVTGISKKYTIGAAPPVPMREAAIRLLRYGTRTLLRQPAPPVQRHSGEFWALEDVSFEVAHGERIGIIGRNGAGKSTLLKILSRVTKPTKGYADVYGRLGALLEVGTGFHPELSGRENIFLNAAILGLKEIEIARRLDEIVAFAEVERFLDVPVKHYSSGMQMRLAFAVAAHLDPDILILDEVLAVGDAAFQKKCLQRMENDTLKGRTVLFVSHSLPSIVAFCTRCLHFEKGRLVDDGDPKEVTTRYLEAVTQQAANSALASRATMRPIFSEAALAGSPPDLADAIRKGERFGDGTALISAVRASAYEPKGKDSTLIQTGDNICVEVDISSVGKVVDGRVAIVILDLEGNRLIDANTEMKGCLIQMDPGEQVTVRFVLQNVLLKPNTYRITAGIARRGIANYDGVPSAAMLTIHMNPALMEDFQIYPAIYQCRFFHEVISTKCVL
jgi:lipopolysaccharide transport system ATP-binding protein